MGSYFLTGEEAPSSTIQEARAQRVVVMYFGEQKSESGWVQGLLFGFGLCLGT